jgi:hypothetical protein
MSNIVRGGTVPAGLFPRSRLLTGVAGLLESHRARVLLHRRQKRARMRNLGRGAASEKAGTREHVGLTTARLALGAPAAVQGAAIQP